MARHPVIAGITIHDELGRGAYSVVYRAEQNGARCALKVPIGTARWTKWVYREAVALARVRHPGLPAVLEVGEADRLPYLLMELVEGETLADRLRKHPHGLAEQDVVDIGSQLAQVLGAVHAAGLVHRDVKPRNIVLERGTGRLTLVDFGFASPMERIQEQAGTAAYAAPEQFTPPGIVDGRADLYAVGKVMGECLAPGISSLRKTHATSASFRERGIDSPLSAIIERLTEPRPEARFPNAEALVGALAALRIGSVAMDPGTPPPIVLPGRSTEIRRAAHHLADLRHGGTLLVLRGIRGAGKSRFLAALQSHAPSFRRHVHVECRPHDAPLTTLRRIFAAVVGAIPSDEPPAIAESLRPIADLLLPARAGTPSNEPFTLAAEALGEGAAELLLDRLATGEPTLVMVDDVQWMDAASADALLRFATRLSNVPLGFVLAARPLATSLLDRLRKSGLPRLVELDLGAIDAQQTREIVESHLSFSPAEDGLVRTVHALSDGTPLGVLEVLGAILDAGVLRPHARAWVFDEGRLSEAALPKGAVALLGRRLGDLPPATRKVLDAAAVIGATFDDETLARVVRVAPEDVGYAIAVAARAGLVLIDPGGGALHRFVHDSLRELLVEEIASHARAALHLDVARLLESRAHLTFEEECRLAEHYDAAGSIADPQRVYDATRRAGEAALRRYDNSTALRFLSLARSAWERGGRRPSAPLLRSIGEAHVRLGSLDDGLRVFEEALGLTDDALSRADLLGRVSWIYQTKALPDEAWTALGKAFSELSERLPAENLPSVLSTSRRYLRLRPADRARHSAEVELLNQLHYQNARLGNEYAKPARLIQSTLSGLELSRKSSSLRAQARAYALYAFLLSALGLPHKAKLALAVADQTAARSNDPATRAFCAQIGFMTAIWGGRLDEALVLLRACVDTYGPWLELNEYCQNIATAETIQAIRGRATEAAEWTNKAVERVRRSQSRLATVAVMHRARASYAAIGRSLDADPWLAEELRAVPLAYEGRGYQRLASWGPRARYYVEADELGADFEALVRAFSAERHNPKKAHVVLVELYVAVAQARMHQALRADPAMRTRRIAELRTAASDLRHGALVPLGKCHSLVVDGTLAFLDGDLAKAGKILASAEELANQQSCPWVLYSVARTRAHMLRAGGKIEAARDQARAAELFARDHGAVTRLRWIREEFDLVDSTVDLPAPSRAGSSSRANRQLTTLLQIARAPRRDLKAEQQAGSILDELIVSLSAERGAIWFQPEPGGRSTAVARHRDDEASVSIAADSARGRLLRRVERGGATWPGPAFDAEPNVAEQFDAERTIAVPLFLYEKSVGALCIERGARDAPFHADDRNLLLLLSHQVPIALEIARLLYEREQLHASLQHAKKMEAVGTLAGGLAHDFNNMLAAMRVALSAAQERAANDAELSSELDIIAQATLRAAQLTGKLLSFSRHQPVPVAVHDVNQLVSALEPMLRRVLGSKIELCVELSPTIDTVEVDQGAFDQALVNLLINARDAMPRGGTLTIKTRSVALGETAAQRANVVPGDYIEIDVIDTGEGMGQETMSRIFEPFFTTKAAGSGTGLGLAMVYAFTRKCGGSIEVSSELGKGTRFRLYLKRATRRRTSRPARPASKPVPQQRAPDTILVVDDDDLVRRSISKILERNGYRVLAASGSVEALDVAREQGARIALVILDVLMPGVTGPELGRRLFELELPAKILFVSGFSPETIPLEDGQVSADMLLQKPFSQSTLLERVRQLMPS
jgi:eukaryotic-like serine/threonine-protein kinase